MADEYGMELEAIAARLQTVGEASVRGDGPGRFVFAFCDTRSVELSRTGTDWWVEFFEGAEMISDRTFASSDEATKAALNWLANAQ
jgi:hypothetical protein